jgi:AmiR/NasT family two-component response regulator
MYQSRLEFLVTCIDIAVYKTITSAIQRIHGAVNYTSTTATARAYIARRKIDGIFLDMALEGAPEMVQNVRRGSSNRYAVIFACAGSKQDASELLNAGVNFVLYKPLLADAVNQSLNTAAQMMEAERKRYLRHQLMVPVLIKRRDNEQKAITSNISRGGMAIRCNDTYEPGAAVQFAFDLPLGEVKGRGEVAWSSTEGFMGIKFFLLGDQEKRSLSTWLDKREAEKG